MKWYPCFLILLTWLILPTSFKSAVSVHNTVKCISKEREALLDFKRGFVDPCNGVFDSWEDQSDCCNWFGVGCHTQTGHVISLKINSSDDGYCSLEGNISSSLVELKHLKYLDLSGNGLSQIIPSFVGSLVNLRYLNLSYNYFYGQIPHQLSNLSRLTSLDLSHNSLNVESLGWLSQLSLLRDINLSRVDLSKATDWLQIVTALPFLRNLQLGGCSLSSTIPSLLSYKNSSSTLSVLDLSANNLNGSSIFKWMSNLTGISTSLKHLDLSSNGITGPILDTIGNMRSLSYLDLSDNGITGSIPDSFGKMHSLSYLDLASNELDGVVPASIFNLTLLKDLHISNNNLQEIQTWNSSGSLCKLETLYLKWNNISSRFSSLIQGFSGCAHKSLVSLDASLNRFWGSIPNEIATFSSLKELDLSSNELNGEISSSLRLPSTLVRLYLGSNSLKGEFSNYHLSNLSRLSDLDLNNNPELVVSIPAEWVPPFQLDNLYLSSCKLGPQFPKWLQTQTNLQDLDISHTGISDKIPSAFWNILSPNLENLTLSHNQIYGGLPNLSTNFTSGFVTVDLSWNHMEGAIPSFLVNVASYFSLKNNKFSGSIATLCPKTMSNLHVLDASNNFLSGELPDCWGKFESLEALCLDNNNFTGKLPPSFGTLTELSWLSLRNNRFHGELQVLFANLTSLAVLDLGHNSFTGDIPRGIWTEGIGVLNLRNNKLSGRLSSSLCSMAKLQVLDISVNQISGTIPECICHLNAMTSSSRAAISWDNSFNEMIMWKRKEQSFGYNLDLVRSIAMSDNELEGHIPDGISCLKGLRSLDLARNKLVGPIPPKIGQLTLLELLDLSSNHLSGQIPPSLANLNFLGTLNLSNNELSGRIPMGTQIQGMDPTAFMGNPGLCGPPLPTCSNDPPNVPPKGQSTTPKEEKHGKSIRNLGLYISVILGFIVGFWGVCGTLVIKRSWRHAYFRFAEDIYDRVYVIVVVTAARVWKRQ